MYAITQLGVVEAKIKKLCLYRTYQTYSTKPTVKNLRFSVYRTVLVFPRLLRPHRNIFVVKNIYHHHLGLAHFKFKILESLVLRLDQRHALKM